MMENKVDVSNVSECLEQEQSEVSTVEDGCTSEYRLIKPQEVSNTYLVFLVMQLYIQISSALSDCRRNSYYPVRGRQLDND